MRPRNLPVVFLVHSSGDAALAGELAVFLERGARVEIPLSEGRIGPGGTLLAKVEEGQSADAILVLLSPDSAPGAWRRDEWVPVFQTQPQEAGIPLAVLQARECKFPDLLRRRNFFDFTRDSLAARRALKRWLLGLYPPSRPPLFAPAKIETFVDLPAEMKALRDSLADTPGTMVVFGPEGSGKTALALEFARRHEDDFEWMAWLSAAGRGLPELAGDFAWQLGNRLERDLAGNLAELRRRAADRRCLVVIDAAAEPEIAEFVPGGFASVLVTTDSIEVSAAFPGGRLELNESHEPRSADLDAREQALLEAIAACPPAGFESEEVAALAGLEEEETRAALVSLRARGLAWELDRNSGSLWTAPRTSPAAPALSSLYARVAARRAGRWASHPEPERLLAGLFHAIRWSLPEPEIETWNVSRGLAQAATAILRQSGRLAEALFLMKQLELASRRRDDRRTLDTCLWEQAWILETWGESAAAETLHRERRQFCVDQMSLQFD